MSLAAAILQFPLILAQRVSSVKSIPLCLQFPRLTSTTKILIATSVPHARPVTCQRRRSAPLCFRQSPSHQSLLRQSQSPLHQSQSRRLAACHQAMPTLLVQPTTCQWVVMQHTSAMMVILSVALEFSSRPSRATETSGSVTSFLACLPLAELPQT